MSEEVQSFEDFLLECNDDPPKKPKKLTKDTAPIKKTIKGKSKIQNIDSKQRSLNLFFAVKPKENGKIDDSESSSEMKNKKSESMESGEKAKISNHKSDTNGQTETKKSKDSKISEKLNGTSSKSKKSSETGLHKLSSPKVADDKKVKSPSTSSKSSTKTQSQQKLSRKKSSDEDVIVVEAGDKSSKRRSTKTNRCNKIIYTSDDDDDDDAVILKEDAGQNLKKQKGNCCKKIIYTSDDDDDDDVVILKEDAGQNLKKQKVSEKEHRKNEDKKKTPKSFFPTLSNVSKKSKHKQQACSKKMTSVDDDVILVKHTPPPAAKKNLLKNSHKKSRTEAKVEEKQEITTPSRRSTRTGFKPENKKGRREDNIVQKKIVEEKVVEKTSKRSSRSVDVVDDMSELKKAKTAGRKGEAKTSRRSVRESLERSGGGGKKRTSDIQQIQQIPLENMWPSKYQPKNSSQMIGNPASLQQLCSTLQNWKEKLLKEEKLEEKRSSKKDDDDDDDFHLSDEDSDDNANKSPNVCVISGAVGCGKTSAVYACAKELGFKVLEINASDVREGKRIMTILHEASQSHNIGNNFRIILPPSNLAAGGSFGKKMKTVTSPKHNFFTKSTTSSSGKQKENHNNKNNHQNHQQKDLNRMSLVLFDEVDAVLPPDKAFWHTVKWFMNASKTPVIITTTDISFLPSDLESNYLAIHMNPSSKGDIRQLIDKMLTEEQSASTKRPKIDINIDDVITSSRLNDVRSSIITSQFWYQTTQWQKQRRRKKTNCEQNCADLISNLPLNIISRMRTTHDVVDCCDGGVDHMSWLLDHHMNQLSSAGFRCLPRSTDKDQLGDTDMESMLEASTLNCEADVATNILEKCCRYQQNTKLYQARCSTGGLYDGVEEQQALFNENPVTYDNRQLLYEIQSYLQISSICRLHNKTSFPITCGDDHTPNINYRKLIHDEDREILFEPFSYHVDRLPMLRNICRMEEIRKSTHQGPRRFRHYLLAFLSPFQIAQLTSTLENC